MPTAPSYPLYKALFTQTVTPQEVKGWSMGFLCYGEEPLTGKDLEMQTMMELVIERKEAKDSVVKVVQVESEPRAAKK
ncbi:predicted protein [Sclerotinia sclerotiorum 1980 UF-70]|nr:predicted protein [Sclerotinia sclerotiorum 1980 UF-70]EDO03293.1 predicted protein [Sclerotinia sclerotiorum 1980 UF-70]